ncbi:DUF2244 domain-containing protein [Azospirillum sp. SYSU D00513]|uniref:DUF2244 domain-containing protein n=1 Tax=Azospirillum sp. SYSU D00513 TaxID=2812561 RepID=UPI001A9722E4|nr:DUF2244 domain-containing protein [Azospirillum sp. SYSU D00513]
MAAEDTSRTADQPPAPVLFDAVLHPHRSLSARGFRILMGVVILINLMVGGIFLAQGAWPILAFCGMDILALWLAFRVNYRAARLYERVQLTETELTVQRVAWKRPERRWSFQPFWLRVSMDEPARHESQVVLSSHGQSLVVGSFLSPDERADFAKALKGALADWRGGPGATA